MASEFAKLNTRLRAADLDQAWQDRLEDARVLETAGRFGSAMAARLYGIEIYLKFRICQRLGIPNPLKKLEIHDLEALIIFAGLSRALAFEPTQSKLRLNWDKLVEFSEKLNDLRYLPASEWTAQQSTDLDSWLSDPTDGVLTWLKTQK